MASGEEKDRGPPAPPVAGTAAASRSRPRPPTESMAPSSYDDAEHIDSPTNIGMSRPSIERAHQELVSDIDAQMRAEPPPVQVDYRRMDPADVAAYHGSQLF